MSTKAEQKIQVLRGTRGVLERSGWCQGRFTGPDGTHCLIGAISTAAGSDLEISAIDDVHEELRREIRSTGYGADHQFEIAISKWNDEPGRTVEEVYGLLDRTVERITGDLGDDETDNVPYEEQLARERGADTSYDERD